MVANQTESARLEQRSVIKFLLAEKCKQCEIYKTMCDVYREIWAEHRFTITSLTQKGTLW